MRKPFWFTDRHGVTLLAHPEDDLDLLFTYRHFFDDEGTLRLCDRLLRPGMTVFDVGSNYGQFALYAAPRICPSGQLHAFEPSSYSFGRLSRNVSRDPLLATCVSLNRCAVTDQPGTAQLHDYGPEHSGWNSLHPHGMWESMASREQQRPPLQPTTVENVPAVTLDRYCDEKGVGRIDLLKIDVEGLELAVLEGANGLIQGGRVAAVVFEISLDALAGTGHTPEIVFQRVSALGYRIGHITPEGLTRDVGRSGFQVPLVGNYLAWPTRCASPC
ncbi:MAG TPA: FkbM family methyltransferase [Gemmataceae bacterium]|nr:FkbM family methyltransferase [Gemmataceae bacterium]